MAANTGCFKSCPLIFFLSLQCLYCLHLYCRKLHTLEHFHSAPSTLLALGEHSVTLLSAAIALTCMSQNYFGFTSPFLTKLQNSWLLSTPVSSLESTIPLLLGKLSSLENRRNKNATVSENIVRIRQLITQARNAASKVGSWEGEVCAQGAGDLR